jgi:hypothetical protein
VTLGAQRPGNDRFRDGRRELRSGQAIAESPGIMFGHAAQHDYHVRKPPGDSVALDLLPRRGETGARSFSGAVLSRVHHRRRQDRTAVI